MADDKDEALLKILRQSVLAVALIDSAERVRFINQAAEQLWGYPKRGVEGRHMSLLLPPSVTADGGWADAVVPSREVRLTRQDGSQLWGSVSLSSIELAGHTYLLAMARDMSAEMEARRQNRLMALAMDHTERPVLLRDGERRIIRVNAAFTRLYGYDAGDVIGCDPIDALTASSLSGTALERLRRLPWGWGRVQADTQVRRKDGLDTWARVSSSPIAVTPDDELFGYSVDVLFDVTEERQIR